jgi:hypothetical protein
MMASSTDTSNESTLKESAASTDDLPLAERSREKTRKGAARRPLPKTLILASMLAAVTTAGAATNALGAGAKFGPACLAQDLSALDVIEERSEVIGMSTKQVAEAVRRFVQARKLCLSGQEGKGISLYQSAINTALGFDSPIVNAMAPSSSLPAAEMSAPFR